MGLNDKISSNIKHWELNYDQNDFLKDKDWAKKSDATEDILQLGHKYSNGPIIDVGFYNDKFKIYIIYKKDWENPKEVFESSDPDIVSKKVYEYIDKYANG